MRQHFTPLRLCVVGLIFAGFLASFADDVLLLPFLAAALILLGIGRIRGWRF